MNAGTIPGYMVFDSRFHITDSRFPLVPNQNYLLAALERLARVGRGKFPWTTSSPSTIPKKADQVDTA